jgi:uncharacterized membrane protein YphA (DoxX/SURF4 family)
MSSIALDPTLVGVLRASLAWILLLAAIHKLRDPRAFADVVAGYRLVPDAAAAPAALALAGAELVAGAALCVPAGGRFGARSAALLLSLYAGAIAVNLLRGRRAIACGCGLAPRPLGAGLVLRNAMLAVLALAASRPGAPRAQGFVDAWTIAFGSVTAVLLFAAADAAAARRARAHA